MAFVFFAPSATLAKTLSGDQVPELTVEAEYGSVVIEGFRYTAAHHQKSGPYAGRHLVEGGRPAPCNDGNIPAVSSGGVILVSHFDLDTLGGVARGLGFGEIFTGSSNEDFWNLAEFVDTHGAHKLSLSSSSEESKEKLYAFWAWSSSNREVWSREEVTDITSYVLRAVEVLRRILSSEGELLEAGRAYREGEETLNRESYLRSEGGILLRRSDRFVNHLYREPGGSLGRAVVALNTKVGSLTVSFADPIPGVSCREIVQSLWGPEAGGHEGIAGSPRERKMGEEDFEDLVRAVRLKLEAIP